MKVTYRYLDGREGSESFESVDEFIMLQNREIPAIDDSAKVVSVEIEGTIYTFTGNIGELFFELNK
ncbi:DUF4649 family protein [Lactococcus nasutitermitis]|uniref:DUF4649 family protein n=1 Tax=Lactococcus nasutitermitis TaxID=1652957 RepID=A0ABV9JE77_9LACT|nr:DUF4649 family protein [Lactococcus nasutitermitis]